MLPRPGSSPFLYLDRRGLWELDLEAGWGRWVGLRGRGGLGRCRGRAGRGGGGWRGCGWWRGGGRCRCSGMFGFGVGGSPFLGL
jgi:hypothetical protein